MSLVPFIGMIGFAIQYIYPGYESVVAVFKERPSEKDLTQWTMYWMFCISFAFLEHNVFFFLDDYLPLYLELKALVFVWLVHPNYLGALWLWHSKLKALHKKLDGEFYGQVIKAIGPLGKVSETNDDEDEPIA